MIESVQYIVFQTKVCNKLTKWHCLFHLFVNKHYPVSSPQVGREISAAVIINWWPVAPLRLAQSSNLGQDWIPKFKSKKTYCVVPHC